ncbi:MAG: DHS-like NAD/FAD-binding domain-containing protein [Aureobasidium pullulans]|nr:MAG: DHS-like NAD/FAD-binding domain-containing protein [Aureobasidium pullulans]THX67346.1 amino acid transporter [Aureobasidium pullulans]THY97510.1 amino acid transporter [Aureobasidium pullulans]TIA21297.1 amino acid transporter [Aureobasidium pullulans]
MSTTATDTTHGADLRRKSSAVVGTEETRNVVDITQLNQEDAALAAQFGYTPVFKRDFGFFATLSFAASISGCFATVTTTFLYPLEAGGAASAVWCWLISGAGCMCIAASVAELVSSYPTSGGLYTCVSRLAPPEWVPSISWITGWLNLVGQICGVASSEYGAAQILLAAVSIGSDGSYKPTAGHYVGVQAALCVFHGLVNSLNTKWLAKITTSYIVFHGAVLVTCAIALLACCDNRHNASYVFTDVTSASGWTPIGFSFLFGFLSVSWTMTDYDATAHITEEIDDPARKAPWAIFIAMALTYVLGWLFTIVLAFTMGDPADALASEYGQPVIQIYYNNLGKAGAIFYAVCAFLILNTVCLTAIHSLARTVFAFSRDQLIPGARLWKKVDKRTDTPILAVWFSVFWCAAINLIALGSPETINAIFNVCAIAMDWSYCIPIICKLVYGRFTPGPWYMGKASTFVNCYAVAWTAFVSIIFLFPTLYPVTAENMNYAIVILAAIFVCAGVYWVLGGRKFYVGPIAEAEVVVGVQHEKDDSSVDKTAM